MTQEELDNKWRELREKFPPEDGSEPNSDHRSYQEFDSWVLWKGGKPSYLIEGLSGSQLGDIWEWVERLGFALFTDPRFTYVDADQSQCNGMIAFPKELEE